MIFDKIEKWNSYNFGEYWQKAFNFIKTLDAESNDGLYEIDGDKIFAKVMSYDTKTEDEAVLESHKKYVDIQTTLVGLEGINFINFSSVENDGDYNDVIDVLFHKKLDKYNGRVDVIPGTFALFFPHDAHMPQLYYDKPSKIKKAVIKIKYELLKL